MAEKPITKAPMTPARRLKLSLLSGFLFIIIIGTIFWAHQTPTKTAVLPTPPVSQLQGKIAADIFRYQGKSGIDALTLLKQATTVEEDNSGLVTSINNRKADSAKHEYWSFFVNNKMAEVGPKDYITQDSDLIEWKIQSY